jgi:catechol 2,3-dioxygenase-like lactoylglutathione lyase family enzyme
VPKLVSIMPAVPVRNLDASLAFYRDKLGFTVRHREQGGAIIVRDATERHLTQLDDESWKTRPDFLSRPVKTGAESFLPGTASYRIGVDDVRLLHEECVAMGIVSPNAPLREQWWGDVDFGVLDVDRNLVTFFQHTSREPSQS